MLEPVRNSGCCYTSPPPLHHPWGEKKKKKRAKIKVKTQNKSMLHEEYKEHGLDTYMWNSSKFQNTTMMIYKQVSTVFASAIKPSSCIAVPPPSQHRWNNPATSWCQHGRGGCWKHKSLDKGLTKPAVTEGRGSRERSKQHGLTTFSGQKSLKIK